MILADKIINLRKKNGWSQEELAEKMNVSRQAVSKWGRKFRRKNKKKEKCLNYSNCSLLASVPCNFSLQAFIGA